MHLSFKKNENSRIEKGFFPEVISIFIHFQADQWSLTQRSKMSSLWCWQQWGWDRQFASSVQQQEDLKFKPQLMVNAFASTTSHLWRFQCFVFTIFIHYNKMLYYFGFEHFNTDYRCFLLENYRPFWNNNLNTLTTVYIR